MAYMYKGFIHICQYPTIYDRCFMNFMKGNDFGKNCSVGDIQ